MDTLHLFLSFWLAKEKGLIFILMLPDKSSSTVTWCGVFLVGFVRAEGAALVVDAATLEATQQLKEILVVVQTIGGGARLKERREFVTVTFHSLDVVTKG